MIDGNLQKNDNSLNWSRISMYDGPIIDSHHHIWEWQHYPWLVAPMTPKMFADDYSALRQDYLVEDLIADFGDHNVVKSVHVQANYDPANPVGETAWLQSVADRAGFPHGIIAYADISDADVEATLAGHCEYSNMRGIRHQLYWDDHPLRQYADRPDACLSDEFRRGIELLAKYGLSFELQGFTNQYGYFAELVAGNPGVTFCLVHSGMLTADDDATVSAWHRGIEAFVPLDNLYMKCSGPNMFTQRLDRRHMEIQLDTVLDMFGADRCYFGSNFPLERLWLSYDDLVTTTKKILASRSAADQRKFFHDTAQRLYRL